MKKQKKLQKITKHSKIELFFQKKKYIAKKKKKYLFIFGVYKTTSENLITTHFKENPKDIWYFFNKLFS